MKSFSAAPISSRRRSWPFPRVPDPSAKFQLFASVVRWDISRGREIVCASGEGDYRLSVFDAGGRLVRTIVKAYDPVPVSDQDVDRQMKRIGIQSRDEIIVPRHLPPLSWVYADEDGRFYVSTWQRDPGAGVDVFNIFDPEGRYLCDYPIPGEPLVFKDGKLYAIIQDEEGDPVRQALRRDLEGQVATLSRVALRISRRSRKSRGKRLIRGQEASRFFRWFGQDAFSSLYED